MILCLPLHPDSTAIYRAPTNAGKGFHLKPLRSTICYELLQVAAIGGTQQRGTGRGDHDFGGAHGEESKTTVACRRDNATQHRHHASLTAWDSWLKGRRA